MQLQYLNFTLWGFLSLYLDDAAETNFESSNKKNISLKDIRYEEASNRLAVEAVKRGCTDNVTVMIVDISPKIKKGVDPGQLKDS